jgi:hypothetical protein
MYTFKRDGDVYFLTEWRICCMCCRMVNRNRESHIIGTKNGFILFQHYKCPPQKEREDAVRLLPRA